MNEQTTARIFTMLTLALAFSGVQAEEFDSKEPLEEIVVYAQKREQGIQSVGVSVTAFAAGQIREFGFVNSIDIVAQTPNVSFVTICMWLVRT